jgi:hypothetical protein
MFYFYNVELKHISKYTQCSQEESYVFLMWDRKYFLFKYFNLKGEDNIFSMWNKKSFGIIFKTLLFTIYMAYSHIDYFLIFSYEILKSQIIFKNFPELIWINPYNSGFDLLANPTP